MVHLIPALILFASAGGGVVVRNDGGLHVARDGTVSLSGTLEARGELLVGGRLEIGRDLRLSSASFEDGSELALTGGGTHRLDVPPDLSLWEIAWDGRLSGELRPIPAARGWGQQGPELREREGRPSLAAATGWTGASAEAGSRTTNASTSLSITIIDRIGTRPAGSGPSDRGPPVRS